MTAKLGQARKMTPGMAQEAIDAVLKHGSVRAASEAMGLSRRAVAVRLDYGAKHGMTQPRAQANPSRWRPGEEIVAARKAEFERVRSAAPNRSGNIIFRPDEGLSLIHI
jgi:hypothetical protein